MEQSDEIETTAGEGGRSRLFGAFRRLAVSVERVAAEEAGSSVVRGVAEELREQFPDLEEDLRLLLADALTLVRKLVHAAAQGGDHSLNAAFRGASEAATRGALDELERQWKEGGLPLHDFTETLTRLLDRAADFADSKARHFRNPSENARTIAASAAEGAWMKFQERLPEISDELEGMLPIARKVAQEMGQGLVDGLSTGTGAHSGELTKLLENAGAAVGRGLTAGMIDSLGRGVSAIGPVTPLVTGAAASIAKGATAAVLDEVRSAVVKAGRSVGAILRQPAVALASGAGGLMMLGAFALRRRA